MRDLEAELNKLIKSALILIILLGIFALIYGIYKTTKTAKTLERRTKYVHKINEAQSAAFALLWIEFASSMPDHKIVFKGKETQEADILNQKNFSHPPLSPVSYYNAYGLNSTDLADKINSEISIKFNTQPFDFPKEEGIVLFSMVKKSAKFQEPFDILAPKPFNNSTQNVRYFGINWLSDNSLGSSIKVLFYNSPKDFALSLSAAGEEIILYCTGVQKTPEALYNDIKKKSLSYKGSKIFSKPDSLSIPYIKTPGFISHSALMANEIEGMDKIKIAVIIDNFGFRFNRGGINVEEPMQEDEKDINSSAFDSYKKGREFNFDKNFVIFLMEKGAKEPYYTLFVDNSNILDSSL